MARLAGESSCKEIRQLDEEGLQGAQQPRTSVVAVVDELRAFGEVAGFKTNLSKSSILNLTVPEMDADDLRPLMPFVWAQQEIQYLGLQTRSTPVAIAELNYTVLLCEVWGPWPGGGYLAFRGWDVLQR
ncbi:hypothetical protein NDU88_009076 [Pleurodeles waltl]|uniref:Reverse transcriptase n=1 Tax=Pleurodeles waltl TaxID=8319 RepID=A0AAV7RWM1_PLEWA|nr:hypothetical protein NDU88_009076 [Pleurodeles waltl]